MSKSLNTIVFISHLLTRQTRPPWFLDPEPWTELFKCENIIHYQARFQCILSIGLCSVSCVFSYRLHKMYRNYHMSSFFNNIISILELG
jgi:hypothetical protein